MSYRKMKCSNCGETYKDGHICGVGTDNKRLEEIKGIIHSWLAWDDWNDSQRDTLNDILVYMEQIERVHELEDNYARVWKENENNRKQSKHYRKAIELVLDSALLSESEAQTLLRALEGDPHES